jgi:hypothetical protein
MDDNETVARAGPSANLLVPRPQSGGGHRQDQVVERSRGGRRGMRASI